MSSKFKFDANPHFKPLLESHKKTYKNVILNFEKTFTLEPSEKQNLNEIHKLLNKAKCYEFEVLELLQPFFKLLEKQESDLIKKIENALPDSNFKNPL